jgi:signal transduction histidine kinase
MSSPGALPRATAYRPVNEVPAAAESAVERTQSQLTTAVVLFRLSGLVGMVWVLAGAFFVRGPLPVVPATALVGVVTVDSVLLCIACRRQRRVRVWWALADLAVTAAGLVYWRLAIPGGGLFFMYPYSIIASVAYAVALRRFRAVLLCTLLLSLCNLLPEVFQGSAGLVNPIYDAGTYYPNAVVTFVVSGAMRRGAEQLDAARAEAARNAAARIRLRHARVLHDRVLQTLETLASGPWLAQDSQVHRQVSEEAAWLRGFVAEQDAEGDEAADAAQVSSGLLVGLRALVERCAGEGLHVHLNTAVLEAEPELEDRLEPTVRDELLAAVRELLLNVRKHAGVDHAVLRVVRSEAGLSVTVVDRGKGFDPARVNLRTGLRQSVTARIDELGGEVVIESAPGSGTYARIEVPFSPSM